MLGADEVRQFERDGFVIVGGAVDKATLAELFTVRGTEAAMTPV